MSKTLGRVCVFIALFSFATGAFAQYLTPNSVQVSRVQYDGNTNSGSDYVSPYGFPEIFNDPSGCSTGNSICDIAGIEGSIYIDQFNGEPGTATVGQSLSLPSTGTAVTTYPSPEPGSYITTSFSSKSEGSLNLSSDGTSLTYMGYQANDQLSDVSNNYSLNPVYQLFPNTYTQDPSIGTPVTITAATYTSSSGNTTITLSSPVTLGAGSYFTIAGMTQTGYNGFYATTAAVTNSSTLSFSLKTKLTLTNCNSSATCGGTALYDPPYAFYDREVALINSTGLVSLTPIDNANSGDNPRGALTLDEREFYTFGNSDSTLASGVTLQPDTPITVPTSQNNPGLTIGVRCGIPEQNFSYLLGTYFAGDRTDESAKKHVKDNNWRGGAIATDANGHQQLYVSKGSGGNGDDGVFMVQDPNTGVLPVCSMAEPDNNTATITPLFSAQATVPGGASYQTSPYLPFGFWFANPTTLYVADEGNPPTYVGGTNPFIDADAGTFTLPQLANGSYAADPYAGLEKWVYSGGSWTLAYTIQAGLNMYQPQSVSGYLDTASQPITSYTYGIRNMAGVNNNDGTVTIYAITSQFSSVSGGESDPDSLVGITDSLAATTLPANEQFVTLQTSSPGEVFRGVAYVPPAQGFSRQSQTINFASVGSVTYGQGPITLFATATSGWPVYFTVTSGPATVSGNTLTITGAGSVTVAATQTGNTDYASATTSQTFTVAQATPTLTWPTPAAITYGTVLSATQLDATAGVSGGFAYNPALGTVLTAGLQPLSVTFTPTDNTDYSTVTGTVYLQVNQAMPTVSWSAPSPITYGTALGASQLDATASIGGTFAYSPAAGTVLNAGVQPLSVTFTPNDSVDYTNASDSVNLTVNQANQSITFTQVPATATYGTNFIASANATSGLAVVFSSSGGCTNSGGTYTMTSGTTACSVIANQSGNGNYLAAAQVTKSVSAYQASQSITFSVPPPASAPYQSAFTIAASASSGLPVAYTSSGICSNSGATYTILAPSGSCTIYVNAGGNSNYLAAPQLRATTTGTKATPILTWPTPAPISYGTALNASQLDATSNVAGTFTYKPSTGILSAGTHTLTATFKPTSAADYSTATATVSLVVQQDSTTTAVTSSNQTVTLSKTGTASAMIDYEVSTSYKPAGFVTVTATTGESCTGAINMTTGAGGCRLYFDTAGMRTVTAAYSGDDNHTPSNSDSQTPAVTVTVNQ
jgi:hypothetical protein